MSAVIVRGMGLSCALGQGVADCLAALSAGAVRAEEIELAGLEEPMRMAYYRIPDGAGLFDPARTAVLLPQVAAEAIASAGLTRREVERLPLFVGSSAFSVGQSEAIYRAALQANPETACALPLVGFQHLAATLQQSLGNRGDTYAFNTACTAAANALMCATRMIQLGWYEHALVVGYELANITTLGGFCGLQLIAESVRPFDVARSGIVLGEGIGAVVLSAAERDHAGIHATAGAANIDPFSVTTANPDGTSIEAVQLALLLQAGVSAGEIRGIKSHGTASPMNDAGEAAGIRRVFADLPRICAMKPYVGHTLGACGVNELVLMASALGAGFFPATPGFETEDPALKVSPTRHTSPASTGYYLLNHFGFGGHNTALLIEKRS